MTWRDRLLTPWGAVAVSVALMGVAWVENTIVPWVPFYIVYVALAIGIPWRLRAYRFGPRRPGFGRDLALGAAIGIAAQVTLSILALQLLPRLLTKAGVSEAALATPFWNLGAAHGLLFERLAPHWHTSAAQIQTAYLTFLVVWAGFGEELYFRGYLHEALGRKLRGAAVVALSSFLFGVRHAMQLTFLGHDYPWAAAAVWVLFGTLFGIPLGILYMRTKSLWPPIMAHYVFNIVPFVLALVG